MDAATTRLDLTPKIVHLPREGSVRPTPLKFEGLLRGVTRTDPR
jgi:hypothetical protein